MKINLTLFTTAFLLVFPFSAIFAQDSLAVYKFDEDNLAYIDETTRVPDVTANKSMALYRPATAASSIFWYGPYKQLKAGSYLVQARLKVASNQSDAYLFNLDMVGRAGEVVYGSFGVKPNMFRNSNEWQVFTIPVQIPDNGGLLEIRGMSFTTGITDVYLDYITVIEGDARGFYSSEFSVNGKGNVGIGTIDPKSYKLAVNGNVHAREVQVDIANWPDYVFNPVYQLMPLAQVKEFIDANHHLPEMPSDKEIAKEGIRLGEINKLLTKKIEELTLYLIEKDKKEKEQEERLLRIEKELIRLKDKK
jgi:hypothetical protein